MDPKWECMEKVMSKVVAFRSTTGNQPTTVNGKVSPPARMTNAERRPREYLTAKEVDRLIKAAGQLGRHQHRDKTLILVAFRHALRVTELVNLRWTMVDLEQGLLHVVRLKNGVPSVHPIGGEEIRALRRLQRDQASSSPFVFTTERGGPLTTSTVRKLVQRAGDKASIGFPVHPHMLRHATGYKLANDGQDTRAIQLYMGHRNIQHTVRYTELSSRRFDGFWKD